ncbi:hypothetical protein [Sandaracinus amylolyticus]|uniref:Uncharacterized protein n=1 Tax=Sandaracinus amylolyticus TaxID=927083 RepID=A0A0F6SHI6_9BACT|nr:hypothetical protein [Sandaracinus amylolyticus]AKF10509.1 hypothetical protein DB32_007658 [Sandaracinus amylolyticus]
MLSAVLSQGCIPDFSGFTIVDDIARDDGGMDATVAQEDAGDVNDGGPIDANDPPATPLDTACPTPWEDLVAPFPEVCTGRVSERVGAPFELDDVAITRGSDGVVVIAYDSYDGPDLAELRTLRFHEDAPEHAAAGPVIRPVAVMGEWVGTSVALATQGADTHHLAYWVRSDVGHEIQHRTLRGNLLSEPDPVAISVGARGAVDIEIDAAGLPVVAWHDDETGRNAVRRATGEGTWAIDVNVRSDGDPGIEGVGAVALAAGAGSAMHYAFQWCVSLAVSAPSYSVSTAAASWSAARMIDNSEIEDRASGIGVDLALVGDETFLAYLDWAEQRGAVRLARFTGSGPIAITTLIDDISILNRPGRHPMVIETDAYGLLHLLTARVESPETQLEYWRQVRRGGELEWVVDVVGVIGAVPERVHADMVIGPDRRPHIVYSDPFVGAVVYATVQL